MIYLTKVIATLLLPMGLLWMLLGCVAIFLFWRKQRLYAAIVVVLFVLLTLLGNKGVAKFLLKSLEEPYHTIRPLEQEAPFDAIFILGGGARLRDDGFSYLGFSGDRIALGARLYLKGLTKMVVASATTDGESSDVRNLLESLGVPSDKILIIANPANTTLEMKDFKKLSSEHHWERVGLVTSAWHMSRAMRLAARSDLTFTPLPCDFRGYAKNTQGFSVIPTGRAAFMVETAVWEYLGKVAGR